MKNLLASIAIFMFVFTGCTSLVVQNIENAPVVSEKKLTIAQVKKAIKEAGSKRGWMFKNIAPGKLEGVLNVRGKHTAIIELRYNAKSYSIEYKESKNLKYDPAKGTIHKAYNSWVNNLKNDIDLKLSMY